MTAPGPKPSLCAGPVLSAGPVSPDSTELPALSALSALSATEAALAAVARLVETRGPVMFVQSAGCCDGSLPMCFPDGELAVGERDVLLGRVGGCPFYIDRDLFDRLRRPALVLDVAEGEPEGFSLGAGPGRHFVTRTADRTAP